MLCILCQYTYYIHYISLSLSLFFNTVIQIRTQLSENGMASPILATNCLYSLCCINIKQSNTTQKNMKLTANELKMNESTSCIVYGKYISY